MVSQTDPNHVSRIPSSQSCVMPAWSLQALSFTSPASLEMKAGSCRPAYCVVPLFLCDSSLRILSITRFGILQNQSFIRVGLLVITVSLCFFTSGIHSLSQQQSLLLRSEYIHGHSNEIVLTKVSTMLILRLCKPLSYKTGALNHKECWGLSTDGGENMILLCMTAKTMFHTTTGFSIWKEMQVSELTSGNNISMLDSSYSCSSQSRNLVFLGQVLALLEWRLDD